jgi:hypothetical protein
MTILRWDREAPFEKKLIKSAWDVHGLRSLKLTLKNDAGWPDRLWLIPGGRPLFMELKAPGGKPAPLQQERINALWGLGYYATCVDNYDQAMKHLEKMCR